MPRSFSWGRSIAPLLLLVGCSDPVDAPSAYTDEAFLCGEAATAERDARTAACRQDDQCRGWLSFRGDLQQQRVSVDSPLLLATLEVARFADVGLVRTAIKLHGESPYFALRWVIDDLPAFQETPGELAYTIATKRAQDDRLESSLRLNGGGASMDLSARDGDFRTAWDAREQFGDGHVDFGGGDVIDGCFYARISVGSMP